MTNYSFRSHLARKWHQGKLLFITLVILLGIVAVYTTPARVQAASGTLTPAQCDAFAKAHPTSPLPNSCPDTTDPAACAAAANATPPSIPPGCDADSSQACNAGACDLVSKYISPTAEILSASFGLIATISIILAAIQYSAAGGDPQKVSAAKKRLLATIVAIVAYLFLFAFLQFLIPGGVF